MFIRHLHIENYRGIRSLDWSINARVVPLVGQGDSGKSTILEALDLLFNGSWRLLPTDGLFYQDGNAQSKVLIRSVVSECPIEFENDDSISGAFCGISLGGEVQDELLDDLEPCLIVQLTMTRDELPRWELVGPNGDVRVSLSESQRSRFGYLLIDRDIDRHLSWDQRSVLRRIDTDQRLADILVVKALRQAAVDVDDPLLASVESVVKEWSDVIGRSGVYFNGEFSSRFDPDHHLRGSSWLLADHQRVPLSLYGLGSKRLMVIGLQENLLGPSSVIAIDEVEAGLEPYRLSGLLRKLQARCENQRGQVFVTTHTPRVIEHFGSQILIVRKAADSSVSVTEVPKDAVRTKHSPTGVVRLHAEAVLARRLVVVEGATEAGFVRRLCDVRDSYQSIGTDELGVEIVDAEGGSKVRSKSESFCILGYQVIALLDNDTDTSESDIESMKANGVRVVTTGKGQGLEQYVASYLSRERLVSTLLQLSTVVGIDAIIQRLRAVFGAKTAAIHDLHSLQCPEFDLLVGIALSGKRLESHNIPAMDRGLFKSHDGGVVLANSLVPLDDESKLPPLIRSLFDSIYAPIDDFHG